jgi:NAD(P)-dependent dehydrogenase (short-subunit alcohol dehydrogenase family)
MASYTQTCAAELAATGVNVNAVAPGPVPTPMGETFRAGQDALAASLPAKRKGSEKEVAACILFLERRI